MQMHYSHPTVLLALLTAVSVSAQIDLSPLPACAQTCFTIQLVNTVCSTTDIACLCGDSVYFGDVEVCVLSTCDGDDTTSTLTWATATCDVAGVPLRKRVSGRRY